MISIIAAIGKNYELGKDNDLIWHIKDDLANFKRLTMGKKIVMGENTYKSLPKKLDGREYIVLSYKLKSIDNGLVFNDFSKLLEYLRSLDEEVMIIGGASIYKLFLPYADKLYLTEIDADADADVYFPKFDLDKYEIEKGEAKQAGDLKYKFVFYRRRK